jgi:hypothetical protein
LLNRAGYYRHWGGHTPRAEETAVRDVAQRVWAGPTDAMLPADRRAAARDGFVANHKRVCGWCGKTICCVGANGKVASDMRVFSVRSRRARTGRNPRNGANFAVEEKSFPFFKSGKEMRSASIAGNVSAHLDVTADPLAICFIKLLAATVVANGSQGSHY